MKRLMTLTLLIGSALVSYAYGASSDTTYREAVLQETTTRDVERAIGLYEEVIKDPQAERGLKANAYLRLGICQNKLGQKEAARAAWSQVLENYPDQTQAYQEAKGFLQTLQAQTVAEQAPVKETPRTRVALQFPSIGYSSEGDGGYFITGPALHYYWNRRWATGLEYSGDLLPMDYSGRNIDVTYYGLTTLREWTFVDVLRPFLKAGPGLYQYKTSGGRSEWTGGVLLEGGFSVSAARGFFVTFAIGSHIIAQPEIPTRQVVYDEPGFYSYTYEDRGTSAVIRGIWVPRFAIGYRW